MANFLVINTSFFGDTLLTGPLCQNIKLAYPDAKVIFIVNKPFYEAAKYMKDVDEVIAYDKKKVHKGLGGAWRFYRENKQKLKGSIEASFVIYGNERGIVLSKLFGAKKVYADNQGLIRVLLDNGRMDYGSYTKAQDRHSQLLSCYTGKPVQELPMRYEPPQSASETVDCLLEANGIHPEMDFVAICTTTKKIEKDMKLDQCIKLIDGLKEMKKLPILVGAGKIAKEYAEKLKEQGAKSFVDLTDKTSLAELGAVLKRASTLVSVDTGTLHLGLSVGTPVVAVFYLNSAAHIGTWAPKSFYRHRLMADGDFSAEKMLEDVKALAEEMNARD